MISLHSCDNDNTIRPQRERERERDTCVCVYIYIYNMLHRIILYYIMLHFIIQI